MSTTPSPLSVNNEYAAGPDLKAKRYDRQLRLWGDHGQAALEAARICIVNATATSTEILKALVLPGVGQFTIVDDHKLTSAHANNFFVHKDRLGQSRGSVAAGLLLELNPEVRGDCLEVSADQILVDTPEFFQKFDVVVVTDLKEITLVKLSALLWEANIPLLVVRSYGLIGYIRLQLKEHTVIESHPDNALEDLRLDRPFQTLKDYLETHDMASMTKNQHMHTPYPVILHQALNEWKQAKESSVGPRSFKEKLEFKELIRSRLLRNDEGIPEEEENFEEAIKAVNTALLPSTIPSNVSAIFDDPKCKNLTSSSEEFWVIARAVKEFVENEGCGLLPLRGAIPDMFSDSERYISLQKVYREKAAGDAEDVLKRVHYHMEAIGRPAESVSESSVKKFCREAANIRLVRGNRPICAEYGEVVGSSNILSGERLVGYEGGSDSDKSSWGGDRFDWAEAIEQSPDDDEAMYYLVLRGADHFRSEFSTWPGALDVEQDIARFKVCVSRAVSEYCQGSASAAIKEDYIHEVCRYGGAEVHAVAAFMGGCAAQEVIKLLTKQYVPVDNLFIYNFMSCSSTVIKV